MSRSATATTTDLVDYCLQVAQRARVASRRLAQSCGAVKDEWLMRSAMALRHQTTDLLRENERDLEAAADGGLTAAQIDRLRLTPQRVEAMAEGLEQIARLEDPVGATISTLRRPNGLRISKVRAPLGVVFFIYESRPNVTVDAAAICVKSGNAVILRGGKEAAHSSQALVRVLHQTARDFDIPLDAIQLVDRPDREAVGHFLRFNDCIDVAIPRGGRSLIDKVCAEATMPVIKHFSGNCHVYVDRDVDPEMSRRVVVDSKCQRTGVCNACETLLVHAEHSSTLLPELLEALAERGIEIRGDEVTRAVFAGTLAVTDEDYATEFLDSVIAVRVVDSMDEALEHIARYGSGHTDAIVTNQLAEAERFCREVDSAAVMVNASTRFHDGFQFGLGAEIGISTDRFHARGPCGLEELTTYKYVCIGSGQTLE